MPLLAQNRLFQAGPRSQTSVMRAERSLGDMQKFYRSSMDT